MTIIELPINDLSPDPANLRTHSEAQIGKLVAALRRWGQTLPLLIDVNNVVRVGNARLEAIRRIGWATVKVVKLDLSPTEWVALAIADNKLHDDSDFDQQALANVLASLKVEDVDMLAVGFSPDELAALLSEESSEPQAPPDDFPSFDADLPVEHECPRCRFRWNGATAPQGAA